MSSETLLGLTSDEAVRLLATHGPNTLPRPTPDPLWRKVALAVVEPMSLLLILAAVVAGVVLGETVDAIAILVVVALNVAIGVIQERNAARALEQLEQLQSPVAKVVRDGTTREIPAAEVVPGDVLVLASGDRVGADGTLVRAADASFDESLLTGESLPVAKTVGEPVFAGTLLTRGSSRMLVETTGPATRLGLVASQLDRPPRTTPLQLDLGRLSARLGVVAVLIAAGVFVILGSTGTEWDIAFLTAVALAVAAVPEGLPTAVVLALALGVRRMARRGAIVRRLPAVETLGSATAILTDKTGTLTLNRIGATAVLDPAGTDHAIEDLPAGFRPDVIAICAVCNDAELDPPLGDPIDLGLLEAFGPEGTRVRDRHERLAELPFDSERRRQTVVARRNDHSLALYTKGAPEEVISRCSQVLESDGATHPMTDEERDHLLAIADRDAGAGHRLIALGRRALGAVPERVEEVEHDLVLVGVVRLRDPVRSSAVDTVAAARAAGLEVVMVTGDHPGTAASVAGEVGLDPERVGVGAALRQDGIPEDPLTLAVYARVEPDQKLALVERLQERGQVVAVTGDGVNDAPALRAADIGVAMGASGSEVARQAADMVVTDDDLGTVVHAIAEGRGIYDNIRKVVEYLVGGNLSELAVVLGALVLVPGVGIPLLPLQLLWINLITDGLPALALGVDPGSPELMRRRPRPRSQALLDARVIRKLALRGVLMAAGVLFVGWTVRRAPAADTRTAMFTALVLVQLGYALIARLPTVRLGRALVGALGAGLALQAAALWWTPLAGLLGVSVFPGNGTWGWMALGVGAPLVAMAVWERRRR